MRRLFLLALLLLVGPSAMQADDLRLPLKNGSVRFAVIGDTGTGDVHQRDIAAQLVSWRVKFPFSFVVMMGDNLYGGDSPKDYQKEFEIPYKPLLENGVKFYASLGNHDNPNERLYKPFNMNGERYTRSSLSAPACGSLPSTATTSTTSSWPGSISSSPIAVRTGRSVSSITRRIRRARRTVRQCCSVKDSNRCS